MITSEKIKELIAKQLNKPVSEITDEKEVVKDLGADSLDMVELLSRLEDEEGVSIPEEDLDGMTTVGDIVRELEKIIK